MASSGIKQQRKPWRKKENGEAASSVSKRQRGIGVIISGGRKSMANKIMAISASAKGSGENNSISAYQK